MVSGCEITTITSQQDKSDFYPRAACAEFHFLPVHVWASCSYCVHAPWVKWGYWLVMCVSCDLSRVWLGLAFIRV